MLPFLAQALDSLERAERTGLIALGSAGLVAAFIASYRMLTGAATYAVRSARDDSTNLRHELDLERQARQADQARCDAQLGVLRAEIVTLKRQIAEWTEGTR